ncbi:MAG TPA: SUMF1/EgtB/PvdO family nonheme iron enzyme [Polyangiaceae bacterium]|nr:SUMF1/EgtB/PvdO family nonheme iron enzyme [Polyangiaceae bacterium]
MSFGNGFVRGSTIEVMERGREPVFGKNSFGISVVAPLTALATAPALCAWLLVGCYRGGEEKAGGSASSSSVALSSTPAASRPVTYPAGARSDMAKSSSKTRQWDEADMVRVGAGAFFRGSSDGIANEGPARSITLSAFWIDKYEITTARYARCVDAGACKPTATGRWCNQGNAAKRDHPINCVRSDQAEAYCRWAQARLPTEAEWEKAARGSDGRVYPWGNEPPDCERTVWFDPDTRLHACGKFGTWLVGSKPKGASPYGAMDMAGNVWEWVADAYQADYYAIAPSKDPPGPNAGSYRILRGGGWGHDGRGALRAAKRFPFAGSNQTPGIGFRCAMDDET